MTTTITIHDLFSRPLRFARLRQFAGRVGQGLRGVAGRVRNAFRRGRGGRGRAY